LPCTLVGFALLQDTYAINEPDAPLFERAVSRDAKGTGVEMPHRNASGHPWSDLNLPDQ